MLQLLLIIIRTRFSIAENSLPVFPHRLGIHHIPHEGFFFLFFFFACRIKQFYFISFLFRAITFGQRKENVHIKNADFTMLRFSFDIDMTDVSLAETDLIYDMLFSGYNSLFFIEMSEKRGLCYDISGYIEKYSNIGELSFSFEVRGGRLYDAVEMITAAPATRLGLTTKGRLNVGADADITIFDYETIQDGATFAQPNLPPEHQKL